METILSAVIAGAVTLIGVLIANHRIADLEQNEKVRN
jgi:hypothetical protein